MCGGVTVSRYAIYARAHYLTIAYNYGSKRSATISNIVRGEIYRQTHKLFDGIFLHKLMFLMPREFVSQTYDHFARLDHTVYGEELQNAVEIMPTCKDIRTR